MIKDTETGCPVLDDPSLFQKARRWVNLDMRISAGNIIVLIGMIVTISVAWGRMDQKVATVPPDMSAIVVRLKAIEDKQSIEDSRLSEIKEDLRVILKYILDSRKVARASD